MSTDILPLLKEDLDDIVKLFDDDFYFMTTYPAYVSKEELGNFLLYCGNSFKLMCEGRSVGLGFYTGQGEGYVLFKFKTAEALVDDETSHTLFREFMYIMKSRVSEPRRMETIVYEFDEKELSFYEKIGITCEVKKERECFKDGRFWDLLVYSLVGDEITRF